MIYNIPPSKYKTKLFILCYEIVFFIFKQHIYTYSKNNKAISYFLLNVSTAIRLHQGENTNLFETL
jgi:hypothetical protein